jgi:hypothetical protein
VLVGIVLYLAHVSPNGLKKFRQGHHDLDDDPRSESLSTTQYPAKLCKPINWWPDTTDKNQT